MPARAPVRLAIVGVFVAAAALAGRPSPAPQVQHHLVACAPGYPGSKGQAQPAMDEFAAMLADTAGWQPGTLTAEYQETERTGVERLASPDTSLGLVSLPLFLKYEAEMDLRPLARVVQANGSASETWSLVAATGRVTSPQDLAGWQLVGIPAYAPAFVRGPVLGHWGILPPSTEIVFSRRVLGALRRAQAGEPVAVLLDAPQTAALRSLPDADALEVVTASPPLTAALLVAVGDAISPEEAEQLTAGVLQVHRAERFSEVLDTLRLERFEQLDEDALAAARSAYRRVQ